MKSDQPVSVQFALSPSDFSSIDVPAEELEEATSRGVRIVYSFPWGREPLETLWSRGHTELLQTHKGVHSKLQVSQPVFMSLTVSMSAHSFLSVKLPLPNSNVDGAEAL